MIEQVGIPGKDNHTAWSITQDMYGGVVILLTTTDGKKDIRIIAEEAKIEVTQFACLAAKPVDNTIKPR